MQIRVFSYARLPVIIAIGFWNIGMSFTLMASGPTDSQDMIERISHPDPRKKSAYQDRTFDAGNGYASEVVTTGQYAGIKQYDSKSFATKAFDGVKQSWMGKMLFPEKKLSDKLQATNRDATKQFATKSLPEKNYADVEKQSGYSDHDSFATRQFNEKIRTIDNSSALQEELRSKVKKGLSEEEVRNLLNKPL